MINHPFQERDALLRMTVCGGQARVLLMRTTQMAQKAGDLHNASDVAIAAMSRLMTGTAMLGVMLKEDTANTTVIVDGGGPGGRMTCVAHGGNVKISMMNPHLELPALPDGRPDVAGLIGKDGTLTVIRDYGVGEPYIGKTELISGELGEDFAAYYTSSEQTPSIVSLGAIVHEGMVLSAGGVLVQALPGCSAKTLEMLDMRAMLFSGISRDLFEDPLDELADRWFKDMDMVKLGRQPLEYRCDCSREKALRMLKTVGRAQLLEMIREDHGAEMTCHFCHTTHTFSEDDLKALLGSGMN